MVDEKRKKIEGITVRRQEQFLLFKTVRGRNGRMLNARHDIAVVLLSVLFCFLH